MQPPFHRLEEFVPVSQKAMARLSSWMLNRKSVRRLEPIRREGDPVGSVFFLMDGWVTSSVRTQEGRRQIVKVHLPGDMLGFPSLALQHAGETLDALTDGELCVIPAKDIGELFEQCPSLATGLFLSTQKERVALMQELSWIGSSSALGRLSAFLLDLHDRLNAAGLVDDGSFQFPLTQAHLGELLGMTNIHANRMMKQLYETGYIARQGRCIRILNAEGLRDLTPSRPVAFAGAQAWQALGCPGKSET